MSILRRTHGDVTSWSTSQAIPFSASATAGDACFLIALNTAPIGAAPAGWTERASGSAAGYYGKIFRRNAPYSDTPTQPTVTAAGGAGGAAWIEHLYTDSAGMTLDDVVQFATDTDTGSTAFAAVGSSITTLAGDLLLAALALKSATTMSANSTGASLTQAGATLGTQTGNFGLRVTGSSPTQSLQVGSYHRAVTTGATGAPSLTATGGTGASDVGGLAGIIRLREVSADTADAGADQTVAAWDQVTLTGTGSAAGTWSQISGPTVVLSGSGAVRTFEAAPSNTPGATVDRVFRYTVGGATDDVTITTTSAGLFFTTAGGLRAARRTFA